MHIPVKNLVLVGFLLACSGAWAQGAASVGAGAAGAAGVSGQAAKAVNEHTSGARKGHKDEHNKYGSAHKHFSEAKRLKDCERKAEAAPEKRHEGKTPQEYKAQAKKEESAGVADAKEGRAAGRKSRTLARAALMAMATAVASGYYKPNPQQQNELRYLSTSVSPYAAQVENDMKSLGIQMPDDGGGDQLQVVSGDTIQNSDFAGGDNGDGANAKGTEAASAETAQASGRDPAAAPESAARAMTTASLGGAAGAPVSGSGAGSVSGFGNGSMIGLDPQGRKFGGESALKTNILSSDTGAGGSAGTSPNIDEKDLSELQTDFDFNQNAVRRAIGLQSKHADNHIQGPAQNIWELIHIRYQALAARNRFLPENP